MSYCLLFLDIRQMEHVPGRSINLAMSVRGLSALNSIGLGKDLFRNGQNTRIKKMFYPSINRS